MFKIKNINFVILLLSTLASNSSEEKQGIKEKIADLENKWEIEKVIKNDLADDDDRGDINQAKFSPSGRYIACALAGFHEIQIFDVNTGKEDCRLVGHSKSVKCLDYCPRGKFLASGSYDKTLKIWDLSTGICKRTIDNEKNIGSIKFSPDGNIIAFIENISGNLKILDLICDKLYGLNHLYDLKEEKYIVNSLAFSNHNNQLATASANSIKIWSYTHAQNIISRLTNIIPITDLQKIIAHYSNELVLLNTLAGDVGWINCLDFSPDFAKASSGRPNGQFLASGSADCVIKIWDIKSGTCVKTLKTDESITTLSFSVDGDYIVSGGTNYNVPGHRPLGIIKIWDVTTGICIQTINLSEYFNCWVPNINSVEWQRGRILATTGFTCVILENEKLSALYE